MPSSANVGDDRRIRGRDDPDPTEAVDLDPDPSTAEHNHTPTFSVSVWAHAGLMRAEVTSIDVHTIVSPCTASDSRRHLYLAQFHPELASIPVPRDSLGRPPGTFNSQIHRSVARSRAAGGKMEAMHVPLLVQQSKGLAPPIVDGDLNLDRFTIADEQRAKRQCHINGGRGHKQPDPFAGPAKACAIGRRGLRSARRQVGLPARAGRAGQRLAGLPGHVRTSTGATQTSAVDDNANRHDHHDDRHAAEGQQKQRHLTSILAVCGGVGCPRAARPGRAEQLANARSTLTSVRIVGKRDSAFNYGSRRR